MRRLGHLQWFCDPRDEAVRARVRADAAGHARPRADQPQPARQHVVRGGHRPRTRPGGGREGVPHLHAAAGHVLRGGRRGPVPGALAARRRRRRTRLPRARRHGHAADRIPAAARRRHHGGLRDPDRAPALRARRSSRRPRRESWPRPSRRSRSASPSTARCCCSTAPSSACSRPGCRPASRSATWCSTPRSTGCFSRSLGIWGIPLATSIANIFGVRLLYARAAAARRPPRRARAAARVRPHRGRDRARRRRGVRRLARAGRRSWASSCRSS